MKHIAGPLAGLLALAFASCASVPPIETPSGRPECTISGATNDEVQGYILSTLMSDGWMLKSQSSSQLVLWKENTDTLQNALLGSQYDPTTTHELRFVFSGTPESDLRVFGQVALVTNEGSAFEKRSDLSTSKAGHELWLALQRIEGHFEQTSASPDVES